jgi:hypothetical protein
MPGSRSSSSSPSWSGIFGRGILSGKIKSKKALFLIRLVFFFLLFYCLWYLLSPVYNHILAPFSLQILKLSEIGGTHITNSMQVEAKYVFVHHVGSELNPELTVRIRTNVVHFDMVLLFALIWAVPKVKFKKRMRIFLLGFAIIFVLHLFKLFVFVKQDYALHIEVDGVPYWSPFQQRVYCYLNDFILLIVNQIFPVLIWSLLYIKYWWKKGQRIDRSMV